jgi:uncharacterized membrane protein
MRITLRIILSIFIVISVIVVLFTFHQVRQEKKRMAMDLERRASVLGESLKERLNPWSPGLVQRLQIVEIREPERLA